MPKHTYTEKPSAIEVIDPADSDAKELLAQWNVAVADDGQSFMWNGGNGVETRPLAPGMLIAYGGNRVGTIDAASLAAQYEPERPHRP